MLTALLKCVLHMDHQSYLLSSNSQVGHFFFFVETFIIHGFKIEIINNPIKHVKNKL